MRRYLLSRLMYAAITLIGVSLIIFVAARLSGDATYLIVGDSPTEEQIQRARSELGIDKPIWVQYGLFLNGVLHDNFGQSIRYQRPVIEVIGERVPATIELALTAFAIALVAGIGLGVVAAQRRGGWLDHAVRGAAAAAQSMPSFWVGLMAIIIFAVHLGWLPTSGRSGLGSLIMPAVTLALYPLAAVLRITRSSLIETLDSEYVKFLRVKGLSETAIVFKHALRNAFIPIIALTGIQLANLLGGAVITETVFAWPGIGSLMIGAITTHDYPIIQAGVLLTSTFLILLNLAVDVMFGVIDPRVRYG